MELSAFRPQPADPSVKRAFDARWQRILDCVALKQPDRMPVGFFTTFWLAKYGGITIKEHMYNYDKVAELCERACLEFEPDNISNAIEVGAVGRVLDATDFKQLQWAGHGVGDNQPYQYLDREYMSAAEYDEFLTDPTGFYLGKYLPRVAGVYDGLQPLASLTSLTYMGQAFATAMYTMPAVQQALQRLAQAGAVALEQITRTQALKQRLTDLGYPVGFGAVAIAPYDLIADYMRGAKAMMTDIYRRRDKVLLAIDRIKKLTLPATIAMARQNGNPLVFIPLHWAPDGFMSPKHFKEIWWPSFREFMLELIDAGLVPMPMWESDCTSRLEIIKDIPPGKCIYWFERTDMVKAFEVLGDVVALRGNISGSVLNMGTPNDVDMEVKRLVENVWNKGGKLILDTAFGIPDETPVENVRAMYRATR
ncbi:MAG: hypothetical protein KGR48_12325 [Alphaproteobacteria bacterium]|nr:hypothetical protein [Alphaproteobacteria bacterium]MDE2012070.1 hypothetical protein [Alphaproteobacteria bacterium]MDE2073366.1 hypothetical protein [Alphaproteobacteria bacterium]